jgi:hypothetical protein
VEKDEVREERDRRERGEKDGREGRAGQATDSNKKSLSDFYEGKFALLSQVGGRRLSSYLATI